MEVFMKSVTKSIVQVVAVVFMTTALFSVVCAQTAQEWVAPAKYVTMKNPTPASKENIATGKDLYAKHCKSCHGATGLGDGAKAATLDVSCGDFSSAKFQKDSDGSLFYKVTEGRGKMPAFKKTIADDNDRWMIVSYMRTLKGK
jgi:mono/diheme cytochrome c family protein